MNSRDLVLNAIAHEKTPRVPIGYNLKTEHEDQLKAMYGWNQAEIKERFKVDLQTVYLSPPEEFRKKAIKATVSTSFSDSFMIKGDDGLYYDEWGIGNFIQKFDYRFVGANNKVMLATSDIPKMMKHPIDDITLDSLDFYLETKFPKINDETRYTQMKKEIKDYSEKGFAIEADMEMTLFEKAWHLCGMSNLLKLLGKAKRKPNSDENKFVNKLLDAIFNFRMKQIEDYLEIGGIDIIRFGDDVAMQEGLMFGVETWREFFKPRMKKLIEACNNEFHIYCHCDGNVTRLIPDFIEIGVEILNPIQPECMDSVHIKETYGDKLTLYGTIGIQKASYKGVNYPIVPKSEIDRLTTLFVDEVKVRKKELGAEGGLILAPTNKIQPDTYIESIEALYKEMGKEY